MELHCLREKRLTLYNRSTHFRRFSNQISSISLINQVRNRWLIKKENLNRRELKKSRRGFGLGY